MHGMLFAIITVLNSGGTYSPVTQANIQAALNAATCGDEVQIEGGTVTTLDASLLTWNNNGGVPCAPGNEMKLTTTKKAFLPDDNTRVTPSYAPIMPMLYLPGSTFSAATSILNISRLNGQTTGIIVDGIAFKADPYFNGNHSYYISAVNMGLQDVCDTVTNTASNLTANHLLFLSSNATDPGDIGGAVRIEGTNMTYKNSWLDDARNPFSLTDFYGVVSRNGGSGYTIRNNYSGSGISEHIIIGVGAPFCQIGKAVASNWTIEHNHFHNSLKWIPNTSTYTGATPSMKNFIECKSCNGLNARWNSGDNLWTGGGAQFYPITLTPRMSRDQSGCFSADSSQTSPAPHPLRASISGGGTTVTIGYLNADMTIHACSADPMDPDHCAYNFPPGWTSGGGISVNIIPNPVSVYTDWEMASIATVTDQFHFTVTPALTSTVDYGYGAGQYLYWDITNYFNKASNIYISGNFWKNVAQDGNYAGLDTACGGAASAYHTTSDNVQYEHNLHIDDSPDFYTCCLSPTLVSLNHWYLQRINNYAGTNLQITHNTRYQTATAALNYSPPLTQTPNAGGVYLDPSNRLLTNSAISYTGSPQSGFWTGFDYSNNLLLPRLGRIPLPVADGWTATTADLSTSRLFNNPDNGVYDFDTFWTTPCASGVGNRKCGMPLNFLGYPPSATPGDPGNFEPKFVNPAKNDWRVGLTSIYSKAATEGTDVGADVRNVAMIQNLTVTPTDVAVWFKFNVPGPLCGMPGQIEVSSAASGGIHLTNDLGTYTVVNAVRPDYFIRSDSDQYNIRSTPAGCSRMMMIGDNISVNDDETAPVLRDLRLTPSTTYYYRLAVGGAMEKGSFTTSAAVTPPGSWSLKTATTTTHYKLRSGPNAANLVTGATTPCGPGGCTVTLTPDANSRQLVYYILGCDSGGTVSNTWGPYFKMVR